MLLEVGSTLEARKIYADRVQGLRFYHVNYEVKILFKK